MIPTPHQTAAASEAKTVFWLDNQLQLERLDASFIRIGEMTVAPPEIDGAGPGFSSKVKLYLPCAVDTSGHVWHSPGPDKSGWNPAQNKVTLEGSSKPTIDANVKPDQCKDTTRSLGAGIPLKAVQWHASVGAGAPYDPNAKRLAIDENNELWFDAGDTYPAYTGYRFDRGVTATAEYTDNDIPYAVEFRLDGRYTLLSASSRPTSSSPMVTQTPVTGAPSSDLLAPAAIIGMAMLGVALVVRRRRV